MASVCLISWAFSGSLAAFQPQPKKCAFHRPSRSCQRASWFLLTVPILHLRMNLLLPGSMRMSLRPNAHGLKMRMLTQMPLEWSSNVVLDCSFIHIFLRFSTGTSSFLHKALTLILYTHVYWTVHTCVQHPGSMLEEFENDAHHAQGKEGHCKEWPHNQPGSCSWNDKSHSHQTHSNVVSKISRAMDDTICKNVERHWPIAWQLCYCSSNGSTLSWHIIVDVAHDEFPHRFKFCASTGDSEYL